MDIHDFLHRYVPWRYARLYYLAFARLHRLVRPIRYRRMPAGGWGKGWRVLVFRYRPGSRRQLHVLAPVDGDQFDWEVLRRHVRGEPWPDHAHDPGHQKGVMAWAGHHTAVVTEEFGPQRLSMGKLVPGEFGGGVDVGFILIDVRNANI
ncbi:hypothetical protein [Brevundimonas sp.]|uniref:hypothetical protein n=1 Tax=Brevundimonas sp. TaxID=1871086 RepID=UPI002737C556|nr:hypothetical protein [Brevundimonas sp.]MDP3801091.1 hypothetical protein [Brevundimonas sp.]